MIKHHKDKDGRTWHTAFIGKHPLEDGEGKTLTDNIMMTDDGRIVIPCVTPIARTRDGAFNLDDYVDMRGYAALVGETHDSVVNP